MLMPGGGPGPQYTGKPERTLKSLAADLEFWGVDPESHRDDLQGLRIALQQAKRELGGDKGYDFSMYSDEQLTDNYHYTVFPNISFSMKPDGCIWLRATPHPTDPQKCYFDMWYPDTFPAGLERVLLELDEGLGVGRAPGRTPDRYRRRGVVWPGY